MLPKVPVAVAIGLTVAVLATGCAPRGSDSPYWGVRDERAVMVCDSLFGGTGELEVLGAANASIAEARTIATASGLSPDDDPNIVDRGGSEYLALCLIRDDFDTYLFYQFDGEPRSAMIATY